MHGNPRILHTLLAACIGVWRYYRAMRFTYTHLLVSFGLTLICVGCGGGEPGTSNVGGWGGTAGYGGDSAAGGNGGSHEGGDDVVSEDDVATEDPGTETSHPDADADTPVDPFYCPVSFSYRPGPAMSVAVAGEWNGFSATAQPMVPGEPGEFVLTADIEPGLHAYKFVVDGDWRFDPNQARRKYVDDIENSAVKVPDCRLPTWKVVSSQTARPSDGAGMFDAVLTYQDGIEGSGPNTAGFSYSLQHNGSTVPVSINPDATGNISVSLGGLADGKYRLLLTPRTTNGRVGEPVRLVFWIEPEEFSWKDALIYMVLTDRFRDGDPSNNVTPTPDVDLRADWQGGDLQGVRDAIADGTLDSLGVRAIWLSPFQTNPTGAFSADDTHNSAGYHGYWPIKAREVDPRLGGANALHALVKEAHAHGIRILQDFVINHVHEEHEYFKAHPEWFRTGCLCDSPGCGWDEAALYCLFSPYMPDINHTVPAANAAFVEDAVWWMDVFDVDGFRVDAVKHVEEVATRNLAAEIRETFELAGTRNYLVGETAMGCCTDNDYDTISHYIGPHGLDGQFDFPLYHGVSTQTFAMDAEGMLHADYWVGYGLGRYPADAIMSPYINSHDEPRFVTRADPDNVANAYHKWDNIAGAPLSALPYERARIAFAWLLNLPGAPLLYYGDEYGQWGGADPNNRTMWKAPSELNANEQATLAFVRKLGMARKNVVALRRGDYVKLSGVTEDTLVFGRKPASGMSAVVALTRAATPQTVTTAVAVPLGLVNGTVLHDHMGGPDVTVAGGSVTITVPSKGAVVLAP